MQGNEKETKACVHGMISVVIYHFGRLNEARDLCTKLEDQNKDICRETISAKEEIFKN